MTLVVNAKNHSSPTMAGDLLITQQTNQRGYILPAIGQDITQFIPAGQPRPVDLAQKLYIFGKNVCIAVTGDVIEIIKLLEDFRPFCSAGLKPAQIVEHARNYNYSGFKGSSYVMMIIDTENVSDDGMMHVTEVMYGDEFGLETNSFFKEWRLGGSGATAFEQMVNEDRQFFSSFADDDPRQNIVKNGALFSRLLVEERYFLKPLESYFGGGYELVVFDGEKLRKMSDVAYILQTGKYIEGGEIEVQLPMMINFYHYEGNDLFITAVELHDLHMRHEGNYKVMTATQLRKGCLRIPQLVRGEPLGAHPVAINSFETCAIGIGFAIAAPYEHWFKPSGYFETLAISVKFWAEENKLEIRMNKDAQNYIAKIFKDAYPTFKAASGDK